MTKTIEPYTIDFDNTPAGTKVCVVQDHLVREPLSGADVRVWWAEVAIRRQLDEAGIKRICYIDQETFSVLGSIYRRQAFLIYGE